MVLKRLGNNYTLFFRLLGFEPEDIQIAEIDSSRDAMMTIQALWDRYTLLQKKLTFNLLIFPRNPGSGSVTLGHTKHLSDSA